MLAPGQTIIVSGSGTATIGEITKLYLPFIIGLTAIAILIVKVRTMMKGDGIPKKLIRLYFSIKSSMETVWLSGLLFWLATADFISFYSVEKQTLMVAVIALITSIIFTGYMASIGRSKWRLFAISNPVASILLYIIVIITSHELWPLPVSASYSDVYIQWLGLMSFAIIIYMVIWGRREIVNVRL